jgi:hypothetical protein
VFKSWYVLEAASHARAALRFDFPARTVRATREEPLNSRA